MHMRQTNADVDRVHSFTLVLVYVHIYYYFLSNVFPTILTLSLAITVIRVVSFI